MTALYNRERAHIATNGKESKDHSREKEIYPLAFSELLAYIVETKLSTDSPVVFKLADLVSLYKQKLEQFGIASSDSDIHSTRLKDKNCWLKFLSVKPTRVEKIFFWLSRKMLALLFHKLLTILKPSSLEKQPRYCEGIYLIMSSNLMARFTKAVSKMQSHHHYLSSFA